MTFNPNIPLATDQQDVSQGDLLVNNQALDSSFGQDHYRFSDVTANNGKHARVRNPAQSPMPSTAANEPAIFGFTYGNAGVLQVSRGGSDAVPSPLTTLQSPTTPIVLAPGQSTNVLDLSGISLMYGIIYAMDISLLGATRTLAYLIWNGSTLSVQNLQPSSLSPFFSGSIITLTNNTVSPMNNVYWTLDFERIVL